MFSRPYHCLTCSHFAAINFASRPLLPMSCSCCRPPFTSLSHVHLARLIVFFLNPLLHFLSDHISHSLMTCTLFTSSFALFPPHCTLISAPHKRRRIGDGGAKDYLDVEIGEHHCIADDCLLKCPFLAPDQNLCELHKLFGELQSRLFT
jgi:hypothetical protein